MRRKKIIVRPKLADRKGDITKQWYVELSMRNPATDTMERSRIMTYQGISINQIETVEERCNFAKKIIDHYNALIDKGWTIFNDIEKFVYEDQLQYSHAARIYKEQNSDKNYSFYASEFILKSLNDLSKETLTTYRSRYRIFGLWLKSRQYDKRGIEFIDNKIIVEFFLYLKEKRELATKTYRSYHELLNLFFEHLCKHAIIPKNPVYNIPTNRNVKDFGAERIHADDLTKLMKYIDKHDPQLALACRFEYYCGLRPGYEVRLLKMCDLDFRKGYSKVRITMNNSKSKRRREVAIPDVFLEYLLNEWKLNTYDSNLYVFSKNGKPGTRTLGKNSFRFRFNKYREILKFPLEYKLYSMKHTGAVTLAEEGEKIINIRDHLGHTSIATTENYLKRHGFSDSEIIRKNFPKI